MAGEVANWTDSGKADRFKNLALPHLNDVEEIPSEIMAQNQAAVPPPVHH